MKSIKLAVVTSCLLLSSVISKAQLYFQNSTNEPVHVAICLYYDTKNAKFWGSEGWFLVEPGHKIQVNSGIGLNPIIYYYAKSTITQTEYLGNSNLLVHPTDKFFIKNADKSYQQAQNQALVWKPFREVNMKAGPFQLKYTIDLKPLRFNDVTEVSGTLKEARFQVGGDPQKAHILCLNKPITINGIQNVREIQVMFDNTLMAKINASLNRSITIKGELFEGHTSYHIRPVMLSCLAVR